MKKAIYNYFKKIEHIPNYYFKDDFIDVSKDIKKQVDKGIFFVERDEETNMIIFEKEFGYKLPSEIASYINSFWHPSISGYLNMDEAIILFPVLRKNGESNVDVLFGKYGLFSIARSWKKIGDIQKYIPIGWLGYSGRYVLYEVASGNIFLENMDVDGEVEDEPIASSMKELVNNLEIRY